MIKIITEKINRSKGDKGRFFVTCYSCTRPLEGRNQKSSACPAPHNLYTPPRGAESLLRNAFPTIHKINKVKTGGQIQKDRPPRVSDNKNIKISLKAQAHFSGLNDCKHTGKYKTLYAFSAFVQ